MRVPRCLVSQDRAPPQRGGQEVRALVAASLQMPLHEVFARFDDAAIGAASVGQVHRAQLASTGDEVSAAGSAAACCMPVLQHASASSWILQQPVL
jgi:hypothetical protein